MSLIPDSDAVCTACRHKGTHAADCPNPAPWPMIELTKEEALQESAYLAGMKSGWNFGITEDHEGYARAVEMRAGYLKPITAARRAERASRASSKTKQGNQAGTEMTFTLDTSGEVICPAIIAMTGEPDAIFLTYRWTDLDAFTQGYVAALMAEVVLEHNSLIPHVPLRFADLAPETLTTILRDCAATTAGKADLPAVWGANFWRNRQAGEISAFPPLTPYLGEDGKVRLRLATSETKGLEQQ